MIPNEWLVEAQQRLEGKVLRTPRIHDRVASIFLKLENLQITGSFKIRGALNRILTLSEDERARVVTASAGNHGLGVAYGIRLAGGKAVIFVSDHAVPQKVEAIRALGGEIREVRGGYGEAEATAIRFAEAMNGTFISPYDDPQVIAGQATVGFELVDQLEGNPIRSVIVPVGGGGLLAGIGLAMKEAGIEVKLIGVNPEESKFFYSQYTHEIQAGVEDRPTLADGLAGAINPAAITIPILKNLGASIITIEESAIREAIHTLWNEYGQKVEGSAAIALAAISQDPSIEKPATVILTGGNIQQEVFTGLVGDSKKKQ
jgi:threonine dehydratase